MYDFDLLKNEKIKKIIDDVLVYNDNKLYSFIITNKRILILDYPSGYHNSMEDLRMSGKINYVRMKEIILAKKIEDIKEISNEKNIIRFKDNSFIEIDNSRVCAELMKVVK